MLTNGIAEHRGEGCSEVHRKQVYMQNTRAKITNRKLHKVDFQPPTDSSDAAVGGAIKRTSRSARTFVNRGLQFIEALRFRPIEKVRLTREVLGEKCTVRNLSGWSIVRLSPGELSETSARYPTTRSRWTLRFRYDSGILVK